MQSIPGEDQEIPMEPRPGARHIPTETPPPVLTVCITAYFINLAVKTKLHIDAPRAEETDRQALLDFFDYFPQNKKFAYIKESDFEFKPVRASRASTRLINDDFDGFGVSSDLDNGEGPRRDLVRSHRHSQTFMLLQPTCPIPRRLGSCGEVVAHWTLTVESVTHISVFPGGVVAN